MNSIGEEIIPLASLDNSSQNKKNNSPVEPNLSNDADSIDNFQLNLLHTQPTPYDYSKVTVNDISDNVPLSFWSQSSCKHPDGQIARKLSNFAPLNTPLVYKGLSFVTLEHAYQAQKFISSNFAFAFCFSLKCRHYYIGDSPFSAKKAGSKGYKNTLKSTLGYPIERPIGVVPSWSREQSVPIMDELLRIKFSDPDFQEALLSTGNRPLLHFSRFGGLWGTNLISGQPDVEVNEGATGANMLGKLLMIIRSELQNNLKLGVVTQYDQTVTFDEETPANQVETEIPSETTTNSTITL